MQKFGQRILAVTLAVSLLLPANPLWARAEEASQKHIQILQTSDIHGKFVPFKYATYEEDMSGSLAQIATVIKERRDDDTILVDVGDTIQDNSADLFLNDDVHPMIKGFNELGFDYWTVGNHEFNFGVPTLQKVIKSFEGTTLAGNVYDKDGKTKLGKTYDVITRKGVKIAVIGMVTPNITKWDTDNLKEYKVTNPIDETKAAIAELKENEQPDVIVVAAHMGVENEFNDVGSGAKDIIDACPEVDLVLAAHGHEKRIEHYKDKLICENLSGGQSLNDVDITVEPDTDGGYKVVSTECENVSIKNVPADPKISAVLEPYNERAKQDAQKPIGTLKGGDLVRETEIEGITQSQIEESAMMNLINDVQLYYANKDSKEKKATVSAAAVFSSEANIKEGSIKKCDASLIYKYDNTIYKLKMTGKQLKQYMEWSVKYYNQFNKGDLTISFNENVRSYLYDIFAGVTYDVNISKPEGNRIENLKYLNGTAVKDTDEIIIALNNYRASSNVTTDGVVYDTKKGDTIPTIIEKDCYNGIAIRDLIAKYIKEVKGGTISPEYRNTWKITGNNWDTAKHDRVVALAAAGLIDIPTSEDGRTPNVKSVTEKDIEAFSARKTARVKFDGNGGVTDGADICYVDGKQYGDVAKAFREGYALKGWYTSKTGGNLLSNEAIKKLNKDTTLFAQWVKTSDIKTNIKSVKADTKSITVTVDAVKNAQGYKVYYTTDKNFKKNVKTVEIAKGKTSTKISSLVSGKVYYIKAVAYVNDSLGNKRLAKTSSVKKIALKMTAPGKASIKSIKAGRKSFTVTMKTLKGAKGFVVYYSTDKKFKKNVKSLVITGKNKVTVKKLLAGKRYYVKVAGFTKDGLGKKYVGKKSAVKSVKTK